jgi:cardiolipin synthase
VSGQAVTIWGVIALGIDLCVKIAALIYIPRNRKPSSAMAWLLAIFLIPYAGLLFFFLVGSSKLPKKRRLKQRRVNEIIAAAAEGAEVEPHDRTWPTWFTTVVELNERLGSVPVTGGNSATLIGDYNESFTLMAEDIDRAQRFVHVEFYIVALDDSTRLLFAALEDAVTRGVRVRVLLDHIASIRTATHKQTFAELDRIGVDWRFMLPVQPLKGKYQRPDLRNHRKLVVVDDRVAYMGSQNLIDRSYNSKKNLKRGLKWQDLMTRLTGPVVGGVNAIFLTDWFCETDEILTEEFVLPREIPQQQGSKVLECQVVPSGPGFDEENNLRLFLALLYSAQERISITSPYFVPDEAMMYAITSARQRGLEVELFVSEIGDQGPVFHAQRSYYRPLLEVGVRIWLYPAPFILHAKHFSIDEDVAVIGSSNMDIRSFNLDLEVSLMVRGGSFVAALRGVQDDYRSLSRELTLAEWNTEPRRSTFLDGLARLTSALQ